MLRSIIRHLPDKPKIIIFEVLMVNLRQQCTRITSIVPQTDSVLEANMSANERAHIEPACAEEEDPALGEFLDFVEADITAHPERIQAFDGALYDTIKTLVGDIDVDLDEPLSPGVLIDET
ncbi:MAG: type II toxin-antitoxin system PrlF family antitoxin [Roseibium sp.]|uniref:type II toxin-antitoxin system PrlF family antitoxin n=1 Tax=Roseibium sp. TaxID=1936156 RepID=UPI00329734B3